MVKEIVENIKENPPPPAYVPIQETRPLPIDQNQYFQQPQQQHARQNYQNSSTINTIEKRQDVKQVATSKLAIELGGRVLKATAIATVAVGTAAATAISNLNKKKIGEKFVYQIHMFKIIHKIMGFNKVLIIRLVRPMSKEMKVTFKIIIMRRTLKLLIILVPNLYSHKCMSNKKLLHIGIQWWIENVGQLCSTILQSTLLFQSLDLCGYYVLV
jgi:hypothetical protein